VTLRARLTAAFLAVVLGPVLLGAVFVGGAVGAVNRDRSNERLDVATTAVWTAMEALCATLRNAAEMAGILAATTQPEEAVRRVLERGSVQEVRLESATGEVLATVGGVSGPWVDCTSPSSRASSRSIGGLAARAELRTSQDRLIGYAVAAVALDRTLVTHLADAAGVDITVLDGRNAPLSTLEPERVQTLAEQATDAAEGEVWETTDGLYVRVIEPDIGQPLRLGLSIGRSDEQGLYAVLLGVVVLAGVLAIIAAWWLARSTTRPLVELAAAADRVAAGDLDARVPVRTSDEVGSLATSFNRMTRETRGYVQALTASRDQLRRNLALLGDTLRSTHDLHRILKVILETARATTGAQAGVVLLLERPDNRRPGVLVGQCAEGLEGRGVELEKLRLNLNEGLLGTVAASGEPRRGRVRRDGPLLSPREPRCHTYIAVPFSGTGHSGDGEELAPTSSGQLLGVLALYDRLGYDDFDDADLVTLQTFASHVAVAVENVLLHQETHRLSLTDDLTELWNYRYLKLSLHREIERATRFNRSLAILALDLDRFKDINDSYGHPVGDAVLMEFADRIRQEIREVDLAFRQGGEEFVVLLPETDSQGGERVAERLCAAIRNTPFRPDSGYRAGNPLSINVTVSIGIAVFPLHGRTGEEVLEAADDALYAAKAAGRNTWRVARTCDPIPPADTTRSCDSATDTPVKESVEDVPVGAPADTSVKALPRTRTPSDSSERP